MYSYFVVNKHIIRVFAWKVEAHPGRYRTYLPTCQALYERASKYGYRAVPLD